MRALSRREVLCALTGLLLTCSFFVPRAAPAADEKRVFRAGAAACNITPPLGEPLVGGWSPIPARNVHDELHARCLVLDDGTTQIGFVICDSLGIQRDVFDEARKLIAAETDIPAQNILMAATHTHSATPARSDKYRPFLVRRIADGVRRAQANLAPAKIGWGSIDEPSEVFVRRWFVTDPELRKNPFGGVDEVRMNPPSNHAALLRPAAIPDPEIFFISVQTPDGKPISLLANYGLHYIGGVRSGEISSDYFGIFSQRIGELLGADPQANPPFVGMLSNGTSGDVNNINFQARGERREPYQKMAEVAEKVAHKVLEAHEHIEFHDWIPLASANYDLTLKYRKPDQPMQDYFAEILKQPEDKTVHHPRERNYAARTKSLLEGPDEVVIPLQVLKLGDLAVSGIPFEVIAEIGLELKEKSPFAQTFTIELANDWNGYLPTPAQHKLGGYETWMGTNRVQLDTSDLIIERLLKMMQDLQSKP